MKVWKVWPLWSNLTLVTAAVAAAGAAGPITLAAVEQMTPARIQQLSRDQIDGLLFEADHSVQMFLDANLKGPLPGPVWPSADYTLYFAAQLSYEAWATSDYKKAPGADLTTDGCSFPVAAAYKKAFDTNACRHHDYGYRNLAQYRQTHNESVRKVLDMHLLNDLHLQCLNDSASNASQYACDKAAVAAYAQARKTGAKVFNTVQAHYTNP